ncbi:Asp-tRNA(Asn)/Glu-tRNA(Gln) amidotransferase subunit GatC [Crocinitomix catalasitica]|uniref:Asp-tRNA(Asn)/Glu-tRNA(Gln) amidotransferase subunit GatC n=1 Tax=Crocinitomix catalasitica TaxID=184607 RepID=UPI00048801DC|nr:Asp-tRNA(Asn)/Glu-tRNA(Gln) amidotransferase subunit GatC [Crocinitomix catalasitica]|tara:strand:+ start:277 stop:567 length:291 start_codon:yes stop_codon:yes gene_type:complete
MKITDETVDHIAHLARLEFEGEAKEHIKSDLNNIISFVDQLSAVDTDGVEPLIFMTTSNNVLREDITVDTITQEDALKNAANHDSDYFKITTVLKQ